MESELLTIGATFIIAAVVLVIIGLLARKSLTTGTESNNLATEDAATIANSNKAASKPQVNKSKKEGRFRDRQGTNSVFQHSWLCTSLKGHSGRVLDVDFSSNGRNLVSCSADRTLMLWNTKDFAEKEHKSSRGNVNLDQAKMIRFAPDSKSLVLCLSGGNTLAVYKVVRKENSSAVKFEELEGIQFPEKHKREIIGIGIACSGRYIMSASTDNTIIIWDLRGEILETLETKQGHIHSAAVSPCGRFVASSGFTPDVKVWEVVFDRTGVFKAVNRAFELKGHSSGVYAFNFNQNSTRMVSASKDGTWRLWDTDIRYNQGQEPYLMASGQLELLRSVPDDQVLVAVAPDGGSFAVAAGTQLRVYQSDASDEPEIIEEPHHQEPLSSVRFSNDAKYIASSGDKHIRIFHNVAGCRSLLDSYRKEMLKPKAGEAYKRRLQEQCAELEQTLAQIVNA